jgi:PAS domain S-box-containing protein
MVLLDEKRRHVEVNGAYLNLLGYKRDELIGRPVYELVVGGPTVSAERWREILLESRFTGAAELKCADGAQVRVEVAGHPEVVTGRQLVLLVALRAVRGRRSFREDEKPEPIRELKGLTPRELEVVRLIALGLSGPEIADELHVAHNTVRTHTQNAMTKMAARSRAHLVARTLAEVVWDSTRTGDTSPRTNGAEHR